MMRGLQSLDDWTRRIDDGATPGDVVRDVRAAFDRHGDPSICIGPFHPALDRHAAELSERLVTERGPLFGIPFVVKDNIDVAGTVTSAGLQGVTAVADRSAPAVQSLVDAGALVVAKSNLDQFATGLVGTRSPFGVPGNTLDPSIVPGGSSSGSAVAVGAGLVPFSLGTDTAGSGRIPAAMNQIVGLKPTRGLVSSRGVLPACASLDCVSIFASTVADARRVFEVICHGDPYDPWRRPDRDQRPEVLPEHAVVGVIGGFDLEGVDAAIIESYRSTVDRLAAQGVTLVTVDITMLRTVGSMLYDGPFLAERLAALEPLVNDETSAMLDVTRTIVSRGHGFTAVDYHRAQDHVRRLRMTSTLWRDVHAVALPSIASAPTLAQVADDPIGVNSMLGRFSTFTNLLDMAAITIPDPETVRPGFGVTLHGPALSDLRLAALAEVIAGREGPASPSPVGAAEVVVVGAHLEGQPLNHQLTALGAVLRSRTTTAPVYRLWALADGRRPALERVGSAGAAIEVEVWSIPRGALGTFVLGVQAPLALGSVELGDGSVRPGFVCELGGTAGAIDITEWGGWRSWRAR